MSLDTADRLCICSKEQENGGSVFDTSYARCLELCARVVRSDKSLTWLLCWRGGSLNATGDGSASPSAEGSDISVSPPPLDEALLDPAVKPMEGEESKNATDDTQEAADTEHESQEEEAKPEPSNSVVPEAVRPRRQRRFAKYPMGAKRCVS